MVVPKHLCFSDSSFEVFFWKPLLREPPPGPVASKEQFSEARGLFCINFFLS